jgi:hypothetical protein
MQRERAAHRKYGCDGEWAASAPAAAMLMAEELKTGADTLSITSCGCSTRRALQGSAQAWLL